MKDSWTELWVESRVEQLHIYQSKPDKFALTPTIWGKKDLGVMVSLYCRYCEHGDATHSSEAPIIRPSQRRGPKEVEDRSTCSGDLLRIHR